MTFNGFSQLFRVLVLLSLGGENYWWGECLVSLGFSIAFFLYPIDVKEYIQLNDQTILRFGKELRLGNN